MNWRRLASNARIFFGVTVGAFGTAMLLVGRIGETPFLLLIAIAGFIVVGPKKIIASHRARGEAFKLFLDRNPALKVRVARGRQISRWAFVFYAAAAAWGAIAAKTGLPLLWSLAPTIIGALLSLKGMGEVAAVEGEFLRDWKPPTDG